MRYCAATETGFERLSGKGIDVFTAKVKTRGKDGNPTEFDNPPATEDDYLTLAVAAIEAAYARRGEDVPITKDDILYDATQREINDLVITVVSMRVEWYKVPEVIKPDIKPDDADRPKNE